MNRRIFPVSALLACCWLPAQSPSASPAAAPAHDKAYASSIGFRYSLPSGWEVLDNPSSPDIRNPAGKSAPDAERRGIDCTQMVLTARHGNPPSMIVAVALPYECFGEAMTEKDLPGFAHGVMKGTDSSFDLSASVTATYDLGLHRLWVERSSATVKDHAEHAYTAETVCTLLKRGAACWMAIAADADALAAFEKGAVKLDGDELPALVPATAFGGLSP